MTEKIYFSVTKEFKKEIAEISDKKTKDRTFSAFITKAILEKFERENTKTIDDFQTPQTELDFLPRINEPVTKDQLKLLSNKDLGTLHKMAHYNLQVIKNWVDSHEDRQRAVYVEK